MEFIKNENYKKIISILICILLVFSAFVSQPIEVYANPVIAPIAVEGTAVVLALLIAFGISSDDGSMTKLQEMAVELYNKMPDSMQDLIDSKAAKMVVTSQLFAMCSAHFLSDEWATVKSWFKVNVINKGYISVNEIRPVNLSNYMWTGATNFNSGVMAAYASYSGNKMLLYDESDLQYQIGCFAVTGNFTLYFSDSTHVSVFDKGSTQYAWNGSSVTNFWVASQHLRIVAYDGVFDIEDYNGNVTGSLSSGDKIQYNRDMLFDPDNYPLPKSIDGGVNVNMPYANVGTGTGEDTNVAPIPETSISAPLTLLQIVAAYGSIDAFFKAGNRIALPDGTTIDQPAEYARADSPPVSSAVSEGSIAGDVTGIKGIVGSIQRVIQKILDFLTGARALSLDGILDSAISTFISRTGFDAFQQSFDAFNHMQTGYGQPPKIYLNLHKLIEPSKNVGNFNNQFADQNTLIVDFARLEQITFMGMTLIQLIRAMLSLAMLSITYFYVQAKITPKTII